MEQGAFKTYLSIRSAFERVGELGKFLSAFQLYIDTYGEEITLKELKKKLIKEFCDIDDKLKTYCKDINL